MWRQFFSVAGPFDDDLIAGIGQPVQSTVPENGVIEEAEPSLHAAVAGDDEAGYPMSADDQLVEVGGLLGSEAVEAQVVQDEQVRGEEGSEGPVDGVVNSGLGHGPEEVVSVAEADSMSGPSSRVAQGLGQEGLAHTGGPHQQDVFVLAQEFLGEDGVQEPAIQGDGRRPVEVLQSAGLLEASVPQPQFQAAVGAAVDLVGEDDFQE